MFFSSGFRDNCIQYNWGWQALFWLAFKNQVPAVKSFLHQDYNPEWFIQIWKISVNDVCFLLLEVHKLDFTCQILKRENRRRSVFQMWLISSKEMGDMMHYCNKTLIFLLSIIGFWEAFFLWNSCKSILHCSYGAFHKKTLFKKKKLLYSSLNLPWQLDTSEVNHCAHLKV